MRSKTQTSEIDTTNDSDIKVDTQTMLNASSSVQLIQQHADEPRDPDMELDTQTMHNALSSVQQTQEQVDEPRQLPHFLPSSEPLFMWNNVDGATFTRSLYEEVVKFRKIYLRYPPSR